MLGTYSGVRIVRSATGLQDHEELEGIINDRPPEQLVTLFVDHNMPNVRVSSSIFLGNPRNESMRTSRRTSMDHVVLATLGNRQRRNNYDYSNCMNHLVQVPPNHKIHKNFNRLTHFIQEANVGRGFIKELCYSNDGRIICSPFSHGVRLLSFSPKCEELSTLQPKLPAVKLHEIGTNVSHSNIVLCTKFSPVHPLLVSGCLSGRIVWYQPRL